MKTKYSSVLPAIIIGISIITNIGCKKLVEADLPIDKTTAEAVFSNSGSASAALTNIYYQFKLQIVGGAMSPSVVNGFTSDELILHDESNQLLLSFFTNSLSSRSFNSWSIYYELVFRVNSVIEGVEASTHISDNSKKELVGQAKFLRGFLYFYLVNLYDGVPIVTSTDYKVNMLLPRSSENEVYDQIKKDLTEAQNLVSENYLKPDLLTVSDERVSANKAVVTALLARVYLYIKQWQRAEDEATKVISNSKYSIVTLLSEVFLKNSNEAIWQIEGDISKGENSGDGNFFIPQNSLDVPNAYLSESLLKEISLDDKRREEWLGSIVVGTVSFYYPYKYKERLPSVTSEYNMILRLAEQYLIRAEARAHLGNLSGAMEDLNVLRKRAGIALYSNLNQMELFSAIEKERQIELFTENGHRWFDLKRTGRADEVLSTIKGSDWQPTDKLFPIPFGEFDKNPSLRGHQNPGYTEN